MGLFIKKPLEALQAEANQTGSKSLKRVLGPWSLVALGVGVIIGAGLFSITGTVAAGYTGPAITLSFAIAAIGCCFAGLCYAEFASMIPVAGSAYTYSYATMGELIAWIIGWDLVLEYTVAATTVSISWSRYLVVFLEGLGINLPTAFTACPWDGGIVNIPAFLIVVLMSLFLIRGTEGSSIFNGIIVFLKVSVVLIFVFLGWKYINTDNYIPYIPANTGTLGEYGLSGVLRGHRILRFLRFRCCQYSCPGSQEPQKRYADRNPRLIARMYHIIYAVRPRHDGRSPLFRIWRPTGNRSRGNCDRTYGRSRCFGRASSGLPLDEQGNRPCHPIRILLGHHGDAVRAEPRFPQHEPRRSITSVLFTYQ